MSRPQERSSGVESGARAPQQAAGNTTSTSESAAGATSASLRDQPGARTQPTSTYAPGTTATHESGQAGTSGNASGGVLSMLAGLIAFLTGLAAVVRQSFYPALPGYAYRWNVHGWGWVLLVSGALLFAAGAVYLLGMSFGKIAAVGLAVVTAIVGFLFLAYTPVWGTIVVALSAFAIWGLLRDQGGDQAAGGAGYGQSSMGAGTTSSGTTTARSSNRM